MSSSEEDEALPSRSRTEAATYGRVGVRQEHISDGATGVAISAAREVIVHGPARIAAERVVLNQTPGARAVHQLPPVTRDFVGRDAEIERLVTSFDKGAAISAVHGMGGIGKTQLALAVAQRVKDRFPDGQIFLDLRGASLSPLTVEDVMSHAIQSLTPEARFGDDSSHIAGLYHSALVDRRVLLVLDNAAGSAQVEPLIPTPPSALLITSRQRFALPGLISVDLDVLGEETAVALIRGICPRAAEDAPELAQCCGYLPLAVRLIASLLASQPDLPSTRLLESLRVGIAQNEVRQLDKCFEASFVYLEHAQRAQWSALGIFPDAFVVGAVADLWNIALEEAEIVMSRLLASSLVSYDFDRQRYRLHDLLRDFALSRLPRARRMELELRLVQSVLVFLRRKEQDYQKGGACRAFAFQRYRAEQPLIATAQRLAAQYAPTSVAAREACIAFDEEGRGLRSAEQDARERLEWARAALTAFVGLPWYRRLMLILRRRNRLELARRWMSLADAHNRSEQGPAAIELYKRVCQTNGLPGWLLREATRSLAWVYSNLGRAEALPLLEETVVLAETPAERASALDGCATYWGNRGNHEKALEFGHQALLEARGTWAEHQVLQGIARREEALGRKALARKHWEESLEKSPSAHATYYALAALSHHAQENGDPVSERKYLEASISQALESGEPEPEFDGRAALYLMSVRNGTPDQTMFSALQAMARKEHLWERYADLLLSEIDRLRNTGSQRGVLILEGELNALLEQHSDDLSPWQIRNFIARHPSGKAAARQLAETLVGMAGGGENRKLKALLHAWLAEESSRATNWAEARREASLAWKVAMQTGDMYLLRSVVSFNYWPRDGSRTNADERTEFAREVTSRWLQLWERTGRTSGALEALQAARRGLNGDDPLVDAALRAARTTAATDEMSHEQLTLLDELRRATAGNERMEVAKRQRDLAKRLRAPWAHAAAVKSLTREMGKSLEKFPAGIDRSFLNGDLIAAEEAKDYPLVLALLDVECSLVRERRAMHSGSDIERDSAQKELEALLRRILAVPSVPNSRAEGAQLELARCLVAQTRAIEAITVLRDCERLSREPETRLSAMLMEADTLKQLRRNDEAMQRARVALDLAQTQPAHCRFDAHKLVWQLELDCGNFEAAEAHLDSLTRLNQEAHLNSDQTLARLSEETTSRKARALEEPVTAH